jgi:hypothetical protein
VKLVLRGHRREETTRFIAFRSHWRFASDFCMPANRTRKAGSRARPATSGVITGCRCRKCSIDDPVKREEFLQALTHGSAVSWRHINLLGEYDFSEERLKDSIGIKPPKLID